MTTFDVPSGKPFSKTLFSTVFQLYHGSPCTYPCFPGVLLPSTPHNILSKPLAAFPCTIFKTMDSGESGMNPVAITIINPQREYWPSWGSNQRPPVLKSTMLPTELWSLALPEMKVREMSMIKKKLNIWIFPKHIYIPVINSLPNTRWQIKFD